jgi:hypothetical protein
VNTGEEFLKKLLAVQGSDCYYGACQSLLNSPEVMAPLVNPVSLLVSVLSVIHRQMFQYQK